MACRTSNWLSATPSDEYGGSVFPVTTMPDLNGKKLIYGVLTGLLIIVIGQIVIALIWLIQLGDRVTDVEKGYIILNARVERIDTNGTRAMILVEDRQSGVLHRLEKIEELMFGKAPPNLPSRN